METLSLSQQPRGGVKRGRVPTSTSSSSHAAAPSFSLSQQSHSYASGLDDEAPAPKRAKKKTSSAAQTTTQTQLAITQIRPTKFARAVQFHRFRWPELDDIKVRRVLELFLPSYLFPSNSRSLVRMKDRDISSSRIIQYVLMLRLLCFLAWNVSSYSYVDPADDEDGGGGGGGKGRRKNKAPIPVAPKSEIVCTWEVVPHRDDPKMAVGYRLRFSEKVIDAMTFGVVHAFKSKVDANELREYNQHLKGGPQVENKRFGTTATISETSIDHITHSRWMRMCMEYAPELRDSVYISSASTLGGQLHDKIRELGDPECPLYILNVFSVERSLEKARNLGAHPSYCDPHTYMREMGTHTRYQFASPETVWHVNHEDLRSYDIENMYMPHIRPDPLEFAAQREAFVAANARPGADEETRKRLADTFNFEVVQTTNNERPMDTYTLDAQVRGDLAEIEAACGKDHRRASLAARARAVDVWLPMLGHIMDPDNISAAPTLRAIGIASQEYLENNGHSFFQLRKRCTANLTRWQDYTASLMASFHTIITVRTNQRDAYLYLLCCMHLYIGSDLNPHVMALGPAGVGKSFLLKLLELLLISGTVRAVSDITLKALNVGGNDNDYVIYAMDDGKASFVGVGSNNRNNNAPSQDRANTTKEMLTTRTATCQTLEINSEGKRSAALYKARTTCLVLINLNDLSKDISEPMLNRFILKHWSSHDGDTQNGHEQIDIIAMTTRSANPLIRAASLHVQSHWNRKQMLFSRIMILIGAKVLTVNLTMANIFFMLVKQRAAKRGVDMEGRRKHSRWLSILTTVVVDDAIDLIWSSPTSPLAPVNGVAVHHDDSHFLLVAKHLRATTQHIIHVIGMLSDQWKNDIQRLVLTAMLKLWFDKNELAAAIQRRTVPISHEETVSSPFKPRVYDANDRLYGRIPSNPEEDLANQQAMYDGMQEKINNWTHLVCDSSAYKNMASNNNSAASSSKYHQHVRMPSQEELSKHIANQLMEHLHPRPLFGEVENIISELMSMTVEETRLVDHGMTIDDDNPRGAQVKDIRVEKKKVSALIVEGNRIRIAISTLANYDVDGVFEATEEVACMLHNAEEPKVYQYGETHAHMPSVWKQITAKRKEFDGKEMRIMNPDHFDSMEAELTNAFLDSTGADKLPETLFEKNEYYVPDVDIDEMVALKHGVSLGLSSVERLQSPSNVEVDCEKEWKAYWDKKQRGKKLKHYPASFVRFTKGAAEKQMEAKAKRNPEMYKMSTQMERLKKQEQAWSADAVVSVPVRRPRAAAAQEEEEKKEEEEEADDSVEREQAFQRDFAVEQEMDCDDD